MKQFSDAANSKKLLDQIIEELREETAWSRLYQTCIDAASAGPNSQAYQNFFGPIVDEFGTASISSVIGKIIARLDVAEQHQRQCARILLDRYGHDKRAFRNMIVGYCVDDDGFATDESGECITFYDPVLQRHRRELVPGELLLKDPSKLVRYDVIDEDGNPYYDWRDPKGNFLMRVCKNYAALIKEALSTDDIALNDPINNLYAILAGMYPEAHDGIGLANFSYTIAHALQTANYREKIAGMGTQAIASISKRQIKNHAQLSIELLDNIKKTGKVGNFNTQDAFHIYQLNTLLDPKNWPILFPEEGIMSYVNFNGEPLAGLDEDGNKIKADVATYEEKMRQVKTKYLFPVVKKIAVFLANYTETVADNQKPGTADQLARTKQLLDDHWSGAAAIREGRIDAYAQNSSFLETSRAVRQRLEMLPNVITTCEHDIRLIVDELFGVSNDIDDIVTTLRYHFGSHLQLGKAIEELDDFIRDNPYVEEDALLETVLELLRIYLDD
ncbi:hypothetical protein FWF89_01630 [Candidatus Saccharibacteria bacterium]|nr:hypothetical protein [Candidatus Saccharibacteria bacterium]